MKPSIFIVVGLLVSMLIVSSCQTAPQASAPPPAPVVVVSPSPPAPAPIVSREKVIFFDDFVPDRGDLRNLWVSNGKGQWLVQSKTSAYPGCDDGCLKQHSEDPRALNTLYLVRNPHMADGVVETKARLSYDLSMTTDPDRIKEIRQFLGAGIVFRSTDENNYYMFRLAGEEGCVLGKMTDNKWKDIANPRRVDFLEGGKIKPNQWYTLKVVTRGQSIQCFINDTPVISASDFEPNLTVGKFGVATFKAMADFEYLRVTE